MSDATPPVTQLIVAMDGPVGVGKSTVARLLAQALGWRHLDTGAMYRAVTLLLKENGHALTDQEFAAEIARGLHIDLRDDGRVFLGERDITHAIRDEEVSRGVSVVADHVGVREALVAEQRRLGLQRPSVLEGRDIATVVFPDAAFKFYLDAHPNVRAARREAQLVRMGRSISSDEVLQNMHERDRRDKARTWGGLRIADGANVVDTSLMTTDEVVKHLVDLIRQDPRVGSFSS